MFPLKTSIQIIREPYKWTSLMIMFKARPWCSVKALIRTAEIPFDAGLVLGLMCFFQESVSCTVLPNLSAHIFLKKTVPYFWNQWCMFLPSLCNDYFQWQCPRASFERTVENYIFLLQKYKQCKKSHSWHGQHAYLSGIRSLQCSVWPLIFRNLPQLVSHCVNRTWGFFKKSLKL